LCLLLASAAFGQSPPAVRPYDGIQAGLDAFRMAEEQRQGAVAVQLGQNEAQRAWAGLPSVRGSAIYYGYPVAAPMADRDFAYAYGAYAYGPPRYGVFEPWPLVPGDIFGGVYVAPLRQPIGQWQGQTGPRRWESHPIYDPPLADFRPLPEVESSHLEHTPYAPPALAPQTEAPPLPAPTRRGPREY
jgi:hypothetical protein